MTRMIWKVKLFHGGGVGGGVCPIFATQPFLPPPIFYIFFYLFFFPLRWEDLLCFKRCSSCNKQTNKCFDLKWTALACEVYVPVWLEEDIDLVDLVQIWCMWRLRWRVIKHRVCETSSEIEGQLHYTLWTWISFLVPSLWQCGWDVQDWGVRGLVWPSGEVKLYTMLVKQTGTGSNPLRLSPLAPQKLWFMKSVLWLLAKVYKEWH